MKEPKSMRGLENLGRVRLSDHFFFRDFLYSEISNFHGIPNIPDDPDLAIEAGTHLCRTLLEPLHRTFGHVTIRSGYRSCEVNGYGNANKLNCASNEKNYAAHIWDRRDAEGRMGATACVVIPWFIDNHDVSEWPMLAWWIHDHLPYHSLYFFPKLAAFNLRWREEPERKIDSYVAPKGTLTKPGMDNWDGDHSEHYRGFPKLAAE